MALCSALPLKRGNPHIQYVDSSLAAEMHFPITFRMGDGAAPFVQDDIVTRRGETGHRKQRLSHVGYLETRHHLVPL